MKTLFALKSRGVSLWTLVNHCIAIAPRTGLQKSISLNLKGLAPSPSTERLIQKK